MMMKYFCQPQILEKKSFSPHIIPTTKGLEESLGLLRLNRQFYKEHIEILAAIKRLIIEDLPRLSMCQ